MAYVKRKKKDKEIDETGVIAEWKKEFKLVVMSAVKAGATKKELQEKVLESFLDYCGKVDISGEDMVDMVMKIAPTKEDIKESDLGAPVSYAKFAESIIEDRDDKVASDYTIQAEEMLKKAEAEKISAQHVQPFKYGEDITYPAGVTFDAQSEAKKQGFSEVTPPSDDEDEFSRNMRKFDAKELVEAAKRHSEEMDNKLMRVRAAAKKGGVIRDVRESLRFNGLSFCEAPSNPFKGVPESERPVLKDDSEDDN